MRCFGGLRSAASDLRRDGHLTKETCRHLIRLDTAAALIRNRDSVRAHEFRERVRNGFVGSAVVFDEGVATEPEAESLLIAASGVLGAEENMVEEFLQKVTVSSCGALAQTELPMPVFLSNIPDSTAKPAPASQPWTFVQRPL